MARATADSWEVVRLGLPGPARPLNTTAEAKPRPDPREDPRTLFDKNVGGPWAPGI